MAIFSTSEFIRSHGKPPRGRGSWAFEFGAKDSMSQPVFFPSSTYKDAKAAAAKYARRIGAEFINVCP